MIPGEWRTLTPGEKGLAAQKRGDRAAARQFYAAALAHDPQASGAANNLGIVLQEAGCHHAAIAHHRHAIAHGSRETVAAAYSNLGKALWFVQRFREAEAACRRAVELEPRNPRFLHNLGLVALDVGEAAKAQKLFESALRLDPTMFWPAHDRAFALLYQDDLAAGLAALETRWKVAPKDAGAWLCGAPLWRGEPLAGKRILVHHEQGFGDSIQFSRYMRRLKDQGARVYCACPPELARLMRWQPYIDAVVPLDATNISTDYHAPLLDVLVALKASWSDIPDGALAVADDNGMQIARNGDRRLHVGLCWAPGQRVATGGDLDDNVLRKAAARALTVTDFLPLAENPNIKLVALQYGGGKEIAAAGAESLIEDATGALTDFAATAVLARNLDVVVSVDTSVCHIAGAVGVPTITLIPVVPCWRWRRDIETTPWYPNMSLVRQLAPGDWSVPLERIRIAIGGMADDHMTTKRKRPA